MLSCMVAWEHMFLLWRDVVEGCCRRQCATHCSGMVVVDVFSPRWSAWCCEVNAHARAGRFCQSGVE